MKYFVTVKPGTSQEKILETSPGELTVWLRAKPHDGEANKALVRLIAKHFGVAKTSISIAKGATGHKKLIEIN